MSESTGTLQDKVAIVTGASKGIGAGIAKRFGAAGASVVVNYASAKQDAERVVAEITAHGGKAIAVQGDMSKAADVQRLFAETAAAFGRLDILVNNAGFAWPREGPIDLELADTPFQVWLKVLNTNLTGTFLCSREALRLMRPQRFGTIINISSPQGKLGRALRGPYSAAKFGVEGLTQVMSLENSSHDIRVNALDPGGIVATEAIRKIPGNKGKKMLSPEIVRACAVYLASDESLGVTGRSFVATEWNEQHGIEVPYMLA